MVCACIAALQLFGVDVVLLCSTFNSEASTFFFLPGSQQGLASPDRASVILIDDKYNNTKKAAMVDYCS